MSANMAMTTSSAQVTDIKRKVYFKESPTILSTTTDSGRINMIKYSHNEFIKKSYVDNKNYVYSKNYEHMSDVMSSPVSEDTRGDEIIHPKMPGHLGTWLYHRWTQTT